MNPLPPFESVIVKNAFVFLKKLLRFLLVISLSCRNFVPVKVAVLHLHDMWNYIQL